MGYIFEAQLKKKRGRPKKQHSIIIDSSDDEKETETNNQNSENNETEIKNNETEIKNNSELESIKDTKVDDLTEQLLACVVE
jgi:hypothetical protein